jgi:hypothetical protein
LRYDQAACAAGLSSCHVDHLLVKVIMRNTSVYIQMFNRFQNVNNAKSQRWRFGIVMWFIFVTAMSVLALTASPSAA